MKKRNQQLKVSVIIPNYNGQDLLAKNLPYVLSAFDNKANNIREIIIVDDGSEDGSIKYLKEKFPKIRLIKHKINRGFPAAVNTGARSAKYEILVLLNTDVRPNKDFLEKVIPHFNNDKVFAVSFHEKEYGWAKGLFKDGFIGHVPGGKSRTAHQTFWISGGSGAFRRSYWMKLKGMDEVLYSPFYWEDVDLSYRAAKRGWELLWEPKSIVIHDHESTTRKISEKYRQRIQERNQLLFIWKNLTSPILFKKHIAGLMKRLSRHPGYIKIVICAIVKLRHVKKARSIEKKECRVSDEAIFARFS